MRGRVTSCWAMARPPASAFGKRASTGSPRRSLPPAWPADRRRDRPAHHLWMLNERQVGARAQSMRVAQRCKVAARILEQLVESGRPDAPDAPALLAHRRRRSSASWVAGRCRLAMRLTRSRSVSSTAPSVISPPCRWATAMPTCAAIKATASCSPRSPSTSGQSGGLRGLGPLPCPPSPDLPAISEWLSPAGVDAAFPMMRRPLRVPRRWCVRIARRGAWRRPAAPPPRRRGAGPHAGRGPKARNPRACRSRRGAHPARHRGGASISRAGTPARGWKPAHRR